ncbi:MAG: S-layer homology domain-containing protein, partial [Cyanobacteria bacterium REEB65]|nr:S-layer homology domain-containing protein [Cyanobacteria bacterium REEB65]
MKNTAPVYLVPILLGLAAPNGYATEAFAATDSAAASASTFTPVGEFTDVSPDHWAYLAIKKLVEKYHIMEGFPDNTFRGTRPISRYELASALAKVMDRVEQLTAAEGSTEGSAPAPLPNTASPVVSPEDLRTIARLQQEFKDELEAIKSRQDTFDQRLLNLEKRVRIGGGLQLFYRTYTAAQYGLNNLRVATHLKLDADISPEFSYSGQLLLLNDGVQSFFNGHQASDGGSNSLHGDDATPIYLRKSFVSWTPPSVTVDAGMLNYSDVLPVGSAIANDFGTSAVWPQAESGYGFVGTPPIQNGHIQLYSPALSTPQAYRAPYHPGVNVVQDELDPDSAADINNGSAGTVAVNGTLGPVEIGAGLNNGIPGADTGEALLNLPAVFPRIAQLNDGYGLGKLGLDLGLFRASVVAHVDDSALGTLADPHHQAGKGFGG